METLPSGSNNRDASFIKSLLIIIGPIYIYIQFFVNNFYFLEIRLKFIYVIYLIVTGISNITYFVVLSNTYTQL